MDGVLPDAEEAINRVTARNSEYFVTIDMSDNGLRPSRSTTV